MSIHGKTRMRQSTLNLERPKHSRTLTDFHRRCYRQAYNIWNTQAIRQNESPNSYLARSQWSLATVLEKIGPQHEGEYQQLKKDATTFLQTHFAGEMPQAKNVSGLFEGIMFYWSR